MTSFNLLNSHLAELGVRIGKQSLCLNENLCCSLSLPNGLIIVVEGHSHDMFCSLSCDLLLMESPGSARERQLLTLAHLNFLGIETGGAILGINPENENINLSLEMNLQVIDYLNFETQLSRFIDQVEIIKVKIITPELKVNSAHDEMPTSNITQYLIKV
jgi:hypothetical protein